ncbi:MAG: quinolinate synthase NadA [Deltaproteobacteria bacterium]|nr:quinolinate synthase NadA [Deltaproteobacteria bacterium]
MDLEADKLIDDIKKIKKELGGELIILTHHYQRPEIVELGDEVGDSYLLCKKAFQSEAKYIVFCGVRFMAESAEILRRDSQRVFHPDPFSGCPMADMSESGDVIRAFNELDDVWGKDAFVPVVYMNSSAEVKSIAGRRGGIICTSSNADKIISHVFSMGKKVIFIPDEYLGFNTYKRLGRGLENIAFWDFSLPLGGNKADELRKKDFVLWKGYCHVHTFFTREHVLEARRKFKGCRIVVHPECKPEVVDNADASGSTEYIVRYVRESPVNSTIIIGTELNLVRRLANIYKDRNIFELARSMCPNMFKITLSKLKVTLENIPNKNRVELPDDIKEYSREALSRMLNIVG